MKLQKNLKDIQYYKFCTYGFLRNLRFFESFFILFLLQRGFNFTSIGTFYAIREISSNFLEIPSGLAADIWGRKKSLIISFLAYITSFLILFLFNNLILFILAFLLYGVGEAFRSGSHKGMMADYLKHHNNESHLIEYYGHTRSWSQRGLAVSSIIAGFIVFFTGTYNEIFLFSVFPYIVNLLLIVSYPEFIDKSSKAKKNGKRENLKLVLNQSLCALKDIRVLNLLNLSALHTAYLKAMKDFLQPMLILLVAFIPSFSGKSEEQNSAIFIGIFYFIIFLLNSFASQQAGVLSKSKLKNIPLNSLLAGLFAGFLSGLFYILNLPLAAVSAFVFIYLIENLRKPILTGYLSENVDNSVLTSMFSVQSQIKTLFTAIIAMIFGVIADSASIGWALVIISLSLFFFSIILKLIMYKRNVHV